MPDVVKFEGHGHALPPVLPHVGKDSEKVVYENKVVIDKETLQPVVEVSERDLDKEIQSYKDECGIAFVLRQIAAGRLSISSVSDDGKHSGDLVGMPETLNEASMLKVVAEEAGRKAAAEAGIKFTEADLQKLIQQEIAKAEAAKKAQITNEGGDK